MAELNNIKNLLLPSIGNYKNRYNNYPKIDDIDKITRLIYKDIDKINKEVKSNLDSIEGNSGHYSLLTPYYFGGVATEKDIALEDVDQWCDVELTLDTAGVFDYRPDAMIAAQPVGHTGTGAVGDPFIFKLEGLTQSSFGSLRASMSFLPDEDEGQLEARLLFTTHTGSAYPSFSIEEVSLNMQNGADISYNTEPTLSFFVGDSVDTNGVGDAGTFKFQVKVTVPGVISMRGLSFYINK
tara:strand:- start:5802 stop:6518 length:717 start_codon:yes stop_codon:yes gene_type:complete